MVAGSKARLMFQPHSGGDGIEGRQGAKRGDRERHLTPLRDIRWRRQKGDRSREHL